MRCVRCMHRWQMTTGYGWNRPRHHAMVSATVYATTARALLHRGPLLLVLLLLMLVLMLRGHWKTRTER